MLYRIGALQKMLKENVYAESILSNINLWL